MTEMLERAQNGNGIRRTKAFVETHLITIVEALAFAALGLWILRDIKGVAAFRWYLIWLPDDFQSYGDIATFFRSLQTAVPPFLALIELVAHVGFGALDLLLTSVFRLVFIVTFALPFIFFTRTPLHRDAAFVASLVFFWSAALVTPTSQQVYDIYYPFFVLAFLIFVRLAAASNSTWSLSATCLSAGFFMSMVELARPFALLVVPILALYAAFALWHLKKRYLLIALFPFLLLSGGWHAKLFVMHDGQVLWSNHGGYNLYKNWGVVMDEIPELLDPKAPENQALRAEEFPGSDRFAGIGHNSDLHALNSEILGNAVMDHIFAHPISATGRILGGVGTILRPQVVIYRIEHDEPIPDEFMKKLTPNSPIIKVYPLFVWGAAGIVFANALAMLIYLAMRRRFDFLKTPETCISLVIVATLLLMSVGEKGEEARFLVSVLPLMAALPFGFRFTRETQNDRSRIQIEVIGHQDDTARSDR